MKILMIAPQPFLEPRGTPISIYQRTLGLSKLGHEIDLVVYHLGEDVKIPGVKIHRIIKVPFIHHINVGPSWVKIPLDILIFIKSFWMLLLKRYDVIHSHEEAAFFSTILSTIFRTKHLYDMHSSLPRQLVNFQFGHNQLMIRLFELFEKLTLKNCSAVITIGPDLDQYVKSINPDIPCTMIENLPLQSQQNKNTFELNQIKDQLGILKRIAIVYTGTFELYQGVELLIESAEDVVRSCPDVVFVLVGGKPDQIDRCKQLVRLNGLEDHVLFLGIIPMEEINHYLDIADILVSPRIEGTSVPLKLYTYLNAGKPIVATRLPGHTPVVVSGAAYLVEPTRESLAAGLIELIHDDSLRKQLGDRAKKLAEEKYNQSIYLSKLEEIYSALQLAEIAPGDPI